MQICKGSADICEVGALAVVDDSLSFALASWHRVCFGDRYLGGRTDHFLHLVLELPGATDVEHVVGAPELLGSVVSLQIFCI